MKFICSLFVGISVFFLCAPAFAKTMYVTDKIQIMMRRGAGTEYKIINRLSSGQSVEVLENNKIWTRIRIPDGMEGWVNTQFLTEQKPEEIALKHLQEAKESLEQEIALMKEENRKLLADNQELRIQTEKSREKQDAAVSAYENLKKESADYLSLKSDYEKASSGLEKMQKKAEKLEIQLETWKGDMKLMGIGVALFFGGFLLGVVNTGSRRKSPYLR
ncbi:MAG: TIGR04211 family SH3 domain-containing protein [Desulfococcaceae bacterium]|jgi:SH3 domain protein|nr:TIGR04211 family SH3 domain-containing protein [Desulfococcaceae bacterium]